MELNRPDIKIRHTAADQFVEVLSIVLLLLLWLIAVRLFFTLPNIIPVRYNLKNQIIHYGSKNVVWILPVIGSFLFILLGAVSKHPNTFNYAVRITGDNAKRQYTLAVRLLLALKCLLLLMFIGFMSEIRNPFPVWTQLLFIVPMLIALLFYTVQSTRN